MINVIVTSAVALSSTQQKILTDALHDKYRGQQLSFVYEIDIHLLAGLSISVDGKLYDASMRAMLQELAKKI